MGKRRWRARATEAACTATPPSALYGQRSERQRGGRRAPPRRHERRPVAAHARPPQPECRQQRQAQSAPTKQTTSWGAPRGSTGHATPAEGGGRGSTRNDKKRARALAPPSRRPPPPPGTLGDAAQRLHITAGGTACDWRGRRVWRRVPRMPIPPPTPSPLLLPKRPPVGDKDEARAGGGGGAVARVTPLTLWNTGLWRVQPQRSRRLAPPCSAAKASGLCTRRSRGSRGEASPRAGGRHPLAPPPPSLWPGPPATPIEAVASGGAHRGTGHVVLRGCAGWADDTPRLPLPLPPSFPPSMAPPLCPYAQQSQAPPPPAGAWAAAEGAGGRAPGGKAAGVPGGRR